MTHQERLEKFEKYRGYAEYVGSEYMKNDRDEGRQCGRIALWNFVNYKSCPDKIPSKWLRSSILDEVLKSEHGFRSANQSREYIAAKRWIMDNGEVHSVESFHMTDGRPVETLASSAIALAVGERINIDSPNVCDEMVCEKEEDAAICDIIQEDMNQELSELVKLRAHGYTFQEIDVKKSRVMGTTQRRMKKLLVDYKKKSDSYIWENYDLQKRERNKRASDPQNNGRNGIYTKRHQGQESQGTASLC